ncbi:MAG: sulfatase [Candidatus Methanomethyliaceae archaeon]
MPKKLPNIILIVLDTARAKNFSCYGYDRKTTPNIDRIAEESTLYKWCFAPANWTIPSHASLFTGLYPTQHGCFGRELILSSDITTLAEILKFRGYDTIGISSNGLVASVNGFARGFNLFFDIWRKNVFTSDWLRHFPSVNRQDSEKSVVGWFMQRVIELVSPSVIDNATPFTTKALSLARKIINEKKSSHPVFLFINIMQNHDFYNPPPISKGRFGSNGFSHKSLIGDSDFIHLKNFLPAIPLERLFSILTSLYDEELFFADMAIGSFYKYLKDESILDNTLFIITSDHGEMLGEDGLLGHGFGLHNDLLRIPLIVRFPGQQKGEVVDDMVQLQDIFSTVNDITESYHPNPGSSYSLVGSKRRRWVMGQNLDPFLHVNGIKKLDPTWECREWWCRPAIIVFKEGLKNALITDSEKIEYLTSCSDINLAISELLVKERD